MRASRVLSSTILLLAIVLGFTQNAFSQETSNSDISIKCTLNDKLSSEYFGYVEVRLANSSDKWHKLSNVRVYFPDASQNQNIRITLGRELTLWYQAQSKLIAVNEQKDKSAMAIIAGIGAGLSIFSGNNTLRTVGDAATFGSFAAYGVNEMGKRMDSLQMAKMIPENHLLTDTTVVPPGLFADRWILLNSRNHDTIEYTTDMAIEYVLESGKMERQNFKLREKYSSVMPSWQRTIFDKKKYLRNNNSNSMCAVYSCSPN